MIIQTLEEDFNFKTKKFEYELGLNISALGKLPFVYRNIA